MLQENVCCTQTMAFLDSFSYANWDDWPSNRRSTTGFYMFVKGNLISERSKKQGVVSTSSIESKYQAIANTTLELVWIRWLLCKFGFGSGSPMRLYYDNWVVIHIANNPMFQNRRNHMRLGVTSFVECTIMRGLVGEKGGKCSSEWLGVMGM